MRSVCVWVWCVCRGRIYLREVFLSSAGAQFRSHHSRTDMAFKCEEQLEDDMAPVCNFFRTCVQCACMHTLSALLICLHAHKHLSQ